MTGLHENVKIVKEFPISRFLWHIKRNPKNIPKNLKVFAEKGIHCVKCGVMATKLVLVRHCDGNEGWMLLTDDDYMTKDHILPRALGGTNMMINLQPCCNKCNGEKKSDVCDAPEDLQDLLQCVNELKLIQTNIHNIQKNLDVEHKRLVTQVQFITDAVKKSQLNPKPKRS